MTILIYPNKTKTMSDDTQEMPSLQNTAPPPHPPRRQKKERWSTNKNKTNFT